MSLSARLEAAERELARWKQKQVRPQEIIDRLQAVERENERLREALERVLPYVPNHLDNHVRAALSAERTK